MPSSSRRSFLALAGAGAAGVGLSSAVGGLAGSSALGVAGSPSVGTTVPATLTGSLVAYIDDVHGDEVSLMIGDDEIVLKDATLVARIAGAAATSNGSTAL
jgi:hypothetical protein